LKEPTGAIEWGTGAACMDGPLDTMVSMGGRFSKLFSATENVSFHKIPCTEMGYSSKSIKHPCARHITIHPVDVAELKEYNDLIYTLAGQFQNFTTKLLIKACNLLADYTPPALYSLDGLAPDDTLANVTAADAAAEMGMTEEDFKLAPYTPLHLAKAMSHKCRDDAEANPLEPHDFQYNIIQFSNGKFMHEGPLSFFRGPLKATNTDAWSPCMARRVMYNRLMQWKTNVGSDIQVLKELTESHEWRSFDDKWDGLDFNHKIYLAEFDYDGVGEAVWSMAFGLSPTLPDVGGMPHSISRGEALAYINMLGEIGVEAGIIDGLALAKWTGQMHEQENRYQVHKAFLPEFYPLPGM